MTPDIRPTRENWHEFCEEPPITEAEQREWQEMARAIREDASGELLDAVVEATKETTAAANALAGAYSAEDWSDMVAWSDAVTRDKRAELAWWRTHNE